MRAARAVRGRWRRLRSASNGVLIAWLFALPWVQIRGEPALLLDVPNRQFHVFGLVIFPQELYFLWLVLAAAVLSLFLFTALAGRLWCGYACPQTVFTDVFAGLARRIEGWKGARPPRRVARWRTLALHAVWAGVAVVVAFHLVSYFVSPYTWIDALRRGAPPTVASSAWLALSVLAYLDFAWLRQRFCKSLCPYARLQGALFDRETWVVGYDEVRGEPRGKRGRAAGACVDCGLCVEVCPSEIDIREGLQLECIACTQCIDACNGVMAKLGRAPNLIGYRQVESGAEGRASWRRPRVLLYGGLLGATAGALVLALASRQDLELTVIRNRAHLYETTANGDVSNAYTLAIENRSRRARQFHLYVAEAHYRLVAGINPIDVPAVSHAQTRVFVLADGPPGDADGVPESREIHFVLEVEDDATRSVKRRTRFIAPAAGEL